MVYCTASSIESNKPEKRKEKKKDIFLGFFLKSGHPTADQKTWKFGNQEMNPEHSMAKRNALRSEKREESFHRLDKRTRWKT